MLAFDGGVSAVLFIAGLLLTAATMLSKKSPKVASLDDALSTSATQGAYVPLVIGRQLVGPVVLWVEDATGGDLVDSPSGTPGMGKGDGSAPTQPSYLERALHGLAVGPGYELLSIRQNNEILWEGRLTPDIAPSGSYIQTSLESGSWFRIYWGFPDDPLIPYIAASESHGVATRYSGCMKVLWDAKDLGQSRQWGRLEYEIVCPCYSQIATSPSEVPRTGSDTGPLNGEFLDLFPDGVFQPPLVRSERYWSLAVSSATNYAGAPEYVFRINSWPETLPIWSRHVLMKLWAVDVDQVPSGGGPSLRTALGITTNQQWYFFRLKTARHFYPAGGATTGTIELVLGADFDPGDYVPDVDLTPPANPTGPVSAGAVGGYFYPIESRSTDGINPIHMIDQLLFAKFPYGSGRDRTKFDTHSIDRAAEVLQGELIRGGISIEDGENVESSLSALMQDIGLMIAFNPETGLYTYRLIRYEEGAVSIDDRLLLDRPEVETIRGDRPVDVVAFTFVDRQRNYRDVPIKVTDNGQIAENDVQRAKKVPIEVTQDRDSVSRIAPRRGQEALGSLSTLKIKTNHQTFLAVPGTRISLPTVEDPSVRFIISSVLRNLNSSRVEMDLLLDAYDPPVDSTGSAAALELDAPPVGPNPFSARALGLQDFVAIEVPRLLSTDQRQVEVFFAASRITGKTVQARFWTSRDDSAFTVHGDAPIVARGTLGAELSQDRPSYDEGSISFDADYQLDLDALEDLTLYEDFWRAGRQVMVVGDEVIFLRDGAVTSPGDPCSGLLSGLIRGRAGTTKATHAAGTPFYVFLSHRMVPQVSAAFLPGKPLYYKAESVERNKYSGIDNVTSKLINLTGKALTPLTPSALRLGAFETVYDAAAAIITFKWSYHSSEFPRTGLGHQACGDATGLSRPGGHFTVRIYDGGETPVLETTTTDTSFELALATRTSLGLDDSSIWTFAVLHVEGSFTSGEATIDIQST